MGYVAPRSGYRLKQKVFTKMRAWTIGRLAKATGVNLETVRYYERIKLMPPPGRAPSGYREYEEAHVQRLMFIRRARDLGFSIEDIRALVALSEPSRGTCADVRKIASEHLDDVRAKLADLAKLELILAETVARCSGDQVPACPILEVLGNASALASP